MCGGVQNTSRPIERCQAMSQCTPKAAASDEPSANQSGHMASMAAARAGFAGISATSGETETLMRRSIAERSGYTRARAADEVP